MKKVLVLFATMVMSFALAITVMANDSPSKETDSTEKDYTEQPAAGTTTSPKTSDEGAPAALVYGALAAAAMSVYAARRLKEQY